MKLLIPGDPATKKNSQRIIHLKNGRTLIRPSKRFESYQESAGRLIPPEARTRLRGPFNVKCVYFMRTRRKVDLVNLLEATCDILVHYGVVEDDNASIIKSHDGSRVLYDKENPRVEITLEAEREDAARKNVRFSDMTEEDSNHDRG